MAKLAELEQLEPNWDGEGGYPVNPQASLRMRQVLAAIANDKTVFPFLSPTGDGGVLAEWHAKPLKLEIEVDAAGREAFFASCERGKVLLPSVGRFQELLRDLSDQVRTQNPQWYELFRS